MEHLYRSLLIRRHLYNQQGEASSLRHLAIAYIVLGRPKAALMHLWQSLLIYHRLGVLSRHRTISMLQELLKWLTGRHRWTK
jgi:hypothetical protein